LTGKEILLFDPRRKPRDWIDLLSPTQCAVLLKDRVTSAALALNGQLCRSTDATCIVFDTLDETQGFRNDANVWKRIASASAARTKRTDSQPYLLARSTT
jgi:hypothetical protein